MFLIIVSPLEEEFRVKGCALRHAVERLVLDTVFVSCALRHSVEWLVLDIVSPMGVHVSAYACGKR